MQQGAADKKLSASSASCSTFAFGSTSICNLAKAATGLGVTLWLVYSLDADKNVWLIVLAFSFWLQQSSPESMGSSSGGQGSYAHNQKSMARRLLALRHRMARTNGRSAQMISTAQSMLLIPTKVGHKIINQLSWNRTRWRDVTLDDTSAAPVRRRYLMRET